jgi:hypothetical protein
LDCDRPMRSRSPQTVLNPSDCGDSRQSTSRFSSQAGRTTSMRKKENHFRPRHVEVLRDPIGLLYYGP